MFGKKCHQCGGKMKKTKREMESSYGKTYKVTIYVCQDCGFETTSGY